MPVDLDAIQARVRQVSDEGDIDVAHALATLTLPAVVAELRAARQVIKAASKHCIGAVDHGTLNQTLEAYDRVVG